MTIEEKAFAGNELMSVEFPPGLKTIERWAFTENPIKSIVIPDGVEIVRMSAFFNNLLTSESITILNDATIIEKWAFDSECYPSENERKE